MLIVIIIIVVGVRYRENVYGVCVCVARVIKGERKKIKKWKIKKYKPCLAKSLIRALSTPLSVRVSLPRNNIIITNN